MKKIFEGVVEYEKEDSGQALVATIYDEVPTNPNPQMFVRIHSWVDASPDSGDPVHAEAERLRKKKVRVTIETIDE